MKKSTFGLVALFLLLSLPISLAAQEPGEKGQTKNKKSYSLEIKDKKAEMDIFWDINKKEMVIEKFHFLAMPNTSHASDFFGKGDYELQTPITIRVTDYTDLIQNEGQKSRHYVQVTAGNDVSDKDFGGKESSEEGFAKSDWSGEEGTAKESSGRNQISVTATFFLDEKGSLVKGDNNGNPQGGSFQKNEIPKGGSLAGNNKNEIDISVKESTGIANEAAAASAGKDKVIISEDLEFKITDFKVIADNTGKASPGDNDTFNIKTNLNN
jgi:hypothetical protein